MKEKYKKILQDNYEYDYTHSRKVQFAYNHTHEYLKKLVEKYDLTRLISKDNFTTVINSLKWVSKKLKGGNPSIFPKNNKNSLTYLMLTDTYNNYSNCFMYSVTLNEILLALGYSSRVVICLSSDPNDNECHSVNIVYLNEFCKWIVIDSAKEAYYINKKGEPLGLLDIRDALINDIPIYIPMCSRENLENIRNYLYKNFVLFKCTLISDFNIYGSQNYESIYLLPKNISKSLFTSENNCIFTKNPNVFFECP